VRNLLFIADESFPGRSRMGSCAEHLWNPNHLVIPNPL